MPQLSFEEKLRVKAGVFALMRVKLPDGTEKPYIPHTGQLPIHFPETPWTRFVAAIGRRWGKTYADAAEVCGEAALPGRNIWIVGPHYAEADRVFHIVYDQLYIRQILGSGSVVRAQKSDQKRLIELANGTIIQGKSGDAPESLRGEQLDLLIVDEAAFCPEDIWYDCLQPCLVDRRGRALLTSTPQGKNWFYRLYMQGYDPEFQDQGWRSAKYASVDNPHLPKEELARVRIDTPDLRWRREFEASFEDLAGAVYPDFQDAMMPGGHLFDPRAAGSVIESLPRWVHYMGIDIGRVHPTACLWAAADEEDNLWVYREYLRVGAVHEEHAEQISTLTSYPIRTRWISADAKRTHGTTRESLKDTPWSVYRKHGVICREAPGDPHDVMRGIDIVNSYLRGALDQTGEHPGLFISSECVHLRQALSDYHYPEESEGTRNKAPERPVKRNDDLVDALRYLVMNRPSGRAILHRGIIDQRSVAEESHLSRRERCYGYRVPRRSRGR